MRHKKMVVLIILMIFISVSIYVIYIFTYTGKLNYVVLGDSISVGRNPYGIDDYGYADYVKDYLDSKGKLGSYLNYAVSGYRIANVVDDINYNKVLETNDGTADLRESLRESDIVTITIGVNDLLDVINLSSFDTIFSDKVDSIVYELDNLLDLIQDYAKGEIIIVGNYNPVPSLEIYKDEINEIIKYLDNKYIELCNGKNVHYIKISDIISTNTDYLPNPLDIHLNIRGYEAISNEIIKKIDEKVLK